MKQVVFLCEHGGAKSLIAAEYFNRIAPERGVMLRSVAVGLDPYQEVPGPVVAGLADKGIDVSGHTPAGVAPDTFADSPIVVHFGCDVTEQISPDSRVEDWGDVPAVSEGFTRAHDIILRRVEQLVAALARGEYERE
jgi:arsenate reductase (thioredoxin)